MNTGDLKDVLASYVLLCPDRQLTIDDLASHLVNNFEMTPRSVSSDLERLLGLSTPMLPIHPRDTTPTLVSICRSCFEINWPKGRKALPEEMKDVVIGLMSLAAAQCVYACQKFDNDQAAATANGRSCN